jgi:prepilin-type processing-associated H-X9-DG protein
MAVSKAYGGANEFLAHQNFGNASTIQPSGGNSLCPGMAFMVMSNELFTPKVLFCPSDNIHPNAATNFSYGDLLGLSAVPVAGGSPTVQIGEASSIDSSKISYFINGDATEANPQDIMMGDDNIGNNGATTSNAFAKFRFGASASGETIVTATPATCVGITTVAFNGSSWWSWTPNDFHLGAGNLSFADGSCQQAGVSGLHYYLNHSTNGGAEAINFMP